MELVWLWRLFTSFFVARGLVAMAPSWVFILYDKGCNVGGPGLDYRNTEVRFPWREEEHDSKPPWRSRLLMLDSILILRRAANFFLLSLKACFVSLVCQTLLIQRLSKRI